MDHIGFVEIHGSAHGATVSLSRGYLEKWISSGRWPCHGLTSEAITMGFDHIGNLQELSSEQDGAAMTALVQEAQVLAIASGFLPRQITLPPEGVASVAREILVVTAGRLEEELRQALERLSERELSRESARGNMADVGTLP